MNGSVGYLLGRGVVVALSRVTVNYPSIGSKTTITYQVLGFKTLQIGGIFNFRLCDRSLG
jgi:hypothetical protein